MIQPIAFLDRDGALIYEPTDTYQIDRLDLLKILEGVIDGLLWLKQKGYRLVIVSNQNGLGTSAFPYQNFAEPHEQFLTMLAEKGIQFERIFICPHFPEDNCDCRKPKIALVEAWLKRQTYIKEQSFMYGDRDTDAEFAKRLGIKFVRATTNGEFQLNKFNFIQ